MNKKIIIITIVILALVYGLWFWSQKSQKQAINSQPIDKSAQSILFYGAECPHCKDLEKFIADNNIKSKVSFEELEVFHNKDNSNFLLEKAKECGVDEKTLGVPFFYARGKCLEGTPDIEDLLKKEAGM